jgi:hypothetical protein
MELGGCGDISGKRTREREGERFSSSIVIILYRWFLHTEENLKEKTRKKKGR